MKITLLRSLMIVGTFLCFAFSQAQEVSGTVSDASGPLPGASVVVKGTTNGTQTDFDGNYTISGLDEDAVLVFSYIGYSTQEVPVAGQTTIDVVMQEDAQALDEVVIVGYGSQAKKEITTAVVSVGVEDFNQGVVQEPTQLLQGKVAGLSVVNRGGNPNADPVIRLRGISTVGGNQQPLVVIDGILGGSLNSVDPSDIENITVLKDGSAAAIYGSRASAGVIVITTKSGKSGQPLQVGYNGQIGVQSIANQIEIMDRGEFLAAGGNDLGSDTDWRDEITQTGVAQVHNISAAGGTDDMTYRIAANFRDTDNILINSGFQQANFRTNFTGRLFDDKLKVTVNTAFTTRDTQFNFNEAFRYATLYNPTAPVFGDDAPFPFNSAQFGGYFETLGLFDSFNPVAIAELNRNDGSSTTLNYNINLNYRISDALALNVNYAEQDRKNNRNQYYPTTGLWRGNALSPTRRGRADFFTEEEDFQLFETYATYTGQIGDLVGLTVTGGYSFQETDYNNNYFQIGDFPPGVDFDFSNNIQVAQDLLEGGRIVANSERQDGDRIIRFFGRVNATFDDAIYLNAALSREGSSRFGSENQWGIFPAVAVGADLNKYLQLDNVNLLKARLGWGVTGSIPPEVGLYRQIFNVQNGADGQSGAATTQDQGRAANPDLKWEEKSEINLGFEFATDRFGATLDLFSRDIKDFIILANVDAAENNGFSQRWENSGIVDVKGIEFAANYDLIKKDNLTYNTGVILTHNKNVLEENPQGDQVLGNLGAPGQNNTNVILVREGEEIGQIWGPVWSGNVDAAGTPILSDINGDGEVIAGQGSALDPNADFAVLGTGLPDLEIGWTNQVTFGKWDANVFFRAVLGHSLVNSFRAFYEPIIGSQASYNFVNTANANPNIKTAQFSDYYVEKADFLRLDNMSIGYNFDLNEDSYIKGLRLSLAAQNLFTITGYDGVDPDPALQDGGLGLSNLRGNNPNQTVSQSQPNVLIPGIERREAYYTATTITFGLNVNF
ncbi:SusC/RagA family TonB-linked outer membrane protein [Flavobacteriaceae bacterium TP-CH-4]|uniref:SusC/RagA family TonB-linked outer membrane protein n=1 Tax=Pelagihabitans pacificus TaxID=2696054 RepID=A0A967E7H9_9FLAO|nr:SusC/RagA family TonB-linked outer membrane protein [Pelagihabitans pacificus]NHF60660.1 SusC/RagA family TonB-linked outer membrane protein [Pelagihabitans pacificus]